MTSFSFSCNCLTRHLMVGIVAPLVWWGFHFCASDSRTSIALLLAIGDQRVGSSPINRTREAQEVAKAPSPDTVRSSSRLSGTVLLPVSSPWLFRCCPRKGCGVVAPILHFDIASFVISIIPSWKRRHSLPRIVEVAAASSGKTSRISSESNCLSSPSMSDHLAVS